MSVSAARAADLQTESLSGVVALFLSAPVASFRVPQAREFLETYPCAPPSTVYGALLSLIGETRREVHAGAELALALLSRPQRSVVLRTLWRVKSAREPLGLGENKRPDFQELLTDVRLAVWLRPGQAESAQPSLADRVVNALGNPTTVERFGGLALGESTHLVDEVRPLRETDGDEGRFLVPSTQGTLTLPLWPDHVGSAGTAWIQCAESPRPLAGGPQPDCWIAVRPDPSPQ